MMKTGTNADRIAWLGHAALALGLAYFGALLLDWQGVFMPVLKASGVGLLALWAIGSARCLDGRLIAAVLGCGALGDWLIETAGLVEGGAAFAVGHVTAIILYARNRRPRLQPSQLALGLAVVPLALLIAWPLVHRADPMLAPVAILYTALVASMAAAAWTSSFPRYRTGLGAMAFLASDLVLLAAEGGTITRAAALWLVWPLYFGGQLLIAHGVVGSLRSRPGAAGDDAALRA